MTPDYNAWKLTTLSPLPHAVLAALIAAALAAFLLAAYGLRREKRPLRRLALLVLRALTALALIALLLEPGLELMQTARIKGRLVVMLDGSRSMAFPARSSGGGSEGRETQSRASVAGAWLKDHSAELAALQERFQVEYATFAGELSGADLPRLITSPPTNGTHTDILSALEGAAEPQSGSRPLSAVLLISDGADNEKLAHGVERPEAKKLQALGVPVTTLSVGEAGLKDLAVSGLKIDDFAFVRNPLSLEVSLKSQGFSSPESDGIPVVLTRAGRVVASQKVSLGKDGAATAKFQFTPDQTGEFVYTVSVPVFPGEAVVENNKRAFVLKVIRDRVRVLLVCGRPSWDERFLRGLLRQDPNVDLVSFFILRGVRDNPHATEDELSLIPFPTEEIFRTQLHSFDLVILQNFAYRPFSSQFSALRIDSYFPDMKRYVQEGGALMMIGGENSFGEGGYDETDLADVIPVTSAAASGQAPSDESFNVRLTAEGRRHPVTQIADSAEESARAWAALPAIPGVNQVRAKPGARVLLEHPLLSIGGQNAPVLVASDEGHGRSMALTTDASWYWSFVAAGAGQGNRHYERFYNNAVRWLVRDPELTPLRLNSEQRQVEPGQPAVFEMQARQSDYGPATGAQVTLQIVDAETEKPVATVHAQTGKDGTGRLEVPSLPAGAYRAIATATQNGAEIGRAEDALAVRPSGPESEDPTPHPEILRRVAEVTGGVSGEIPGRFPKIKAVHESAQVEIGRRKEQPLWDRGFPLFVLCLTLGGEWFLRRRWGYS
jgi:uncharacterized membrane protein